MCQSDAVYGRHHGLWAERQAPTVRLPESSMPWLPEWLRLRGLYEKEHKDNHSSDKTAHPVDLDRSKAL